jgi:hypothetical protein
MVCTHVAQDRDPWRVLVNTVMNMRHIKCLEFLEWLSTCWRLKKELAPWS